MKKYQKPIFEYIDLRAEERIAAEGSSTCYETGHCPDGPVWVGMFPTGV